MLGQRLVRSTLPQPEAQPPGTPPAATGVGGASALAARVPAGPSLAALPRGAGPRRAFLSRYLGRALATMAGYWDGPEGEQCPQRTWLTTRVGAAAGGHRGEGNTRGGRLSGARARAMTCSAVLQAWSGRRIASFCCGPAQL